MSEDRNQNHAEAPATPGTPYVSRARVEIVQGLHRRAHLALGTTADFGVHGPIKELFRLEPERELPLPVDYIVAAAAG
jgi:hypothetical protein